MEFKHARHIAERPEGWLEARLPLVNASEVAGLIKSLFKRSELEQYLPASIIEELYSTNLFTDAYCKWHEAKMKYKKVVSDSNTMFGLSAEKYCSYLLNKQYPNMVIGNMKHCVDDVNQAGATVDNIGLLSKIHKVVIDGIEYSGIFPIEIKTVRYNYHDEEVKQLRKERSMVKFSIGNHLQLQHQIFVLNNTVNKGRKPIDFGVFIALQQNSLDEYWRGIYTHAIQVMSSEDFERVYGDEFYHSVEFVPRIPKVQELLLEVCKRWKKCLASKKPPEPFFDGFNHYDQIRFVDCFNTFNGNLNEYGFNVNTEDVPDNVIEEISELTECIDVNKTAEKKRKNAQIQLTNILLKHKLQRINMNNGLTATLKLNSKSISVNVK